MYNNFLSANCYYANCPDPTVDVMVAREMCYLYLYCVVLDPSLTVAFTVAGLFLRLVVSLWNWKHYVSTLLVRPCVRECLRPEH